MNAFLKPRNILFYLLSSFVFFFLGMMFATLSGAADGQGLAGGAIVFGYGVISGFLAFVVAIFAAAFLREAQIALVNKIWATLLLLFLIFVAYRYQRQTKETQYNDFKVPKLTSPPTDANTKERNRPATTPRQAKE